MCTKTPSSYWETTAFVKMEDSADASFIIKFFIPFITINMQVNVFYIDCKTPALKLSPTFMRLIKSYLFNKRL